MESSKAMDWAALGHKNKIRLGIIFVVIAAACAGAYFFFITDHHASTAGVYPASPLDATYIIDGRPVTLVNGASSSQPVPGSASRTVTKYFGNEAAGDLNGDGIADTAFILTQNSGGSGTFYYAVAAIQKDGGYEGTSAVLLGDRVAPQTTEIKDGILDVNYMDRNPGDSFAVQPSVGKSLFLKLDPATLQFGEIVQNFEGEADPSRMTLTMHTWHWVNTLYNDGTIVTPRDPSKFTLTFTAPNAFSANTDCNGVGGEYVLSGANITFDKMISTLMFCEGSQESEFSKELTQVQSYHFTSKGELIFDLKMDSGSMIFK